MRTADFAYVLPTELIAQAPALERDQSKLFVIDRARREFKHGRFGDLGRLVRSGDLLIMNDSRVLPARLWAQKESSGGKIEVLLLEENSPNDWWVMVRPGKRVREGTSLRFLNVLGHETEIRATALEKNAEGHCRLVFGGVSDILSELEDVGTIPLPPYIYRVPQSGGIDDARRYQTVFAREAGSIAAPTAGLHFTEEALSAIRSLGVSIHYLTLHVGLGTFAPVKTENVAEHPMHEERFQISRATAEAIMETKRSGGRICAVGTTTVRALESVAARNDGAIVPSQGRTRIFIYPPYRFRIVDALLTNFHLPQSTLLMLVSAFAAPEATGGRELILSAYAEAIRERYRFFSYGDAMLIL